VNLNSIGLQFG